MRLILFDIDGTLLNSKRIGRTALGRALEATFGTVGPLDTYQFAGRTDRRIVYDLMLAAGFEPAAIEARLPALHDQMREAGEELFSPATIWPCEGIPELLSELGSRSDVLLGLLTGNIVETAPLKLRAAGIDPSMFGVGAYGADSADRNDLLGVVMKRAKQLTGMTFRGHDTVVIGDTPADVACARSGGALAVAVTTGFYSKEALLACNPDYLFDTLAPTPTVCDAILNGTAQVRSPEAA